MGRELLLYRKIKIFAMSKGNLRLKKKAVPLYGTQEV